jgi:hypothetical protein
MELAEQRHTVVGKSIDGEDLPQRPLAVEPSRIEFGLDLSLGTDVGLPRKCDVSNVSFEPKVLVVDPYRSTQQG